MSGKTTLTLHGRKVVGGVAEGEALVTHDTISGWGGVNPMTGTIIETRHELHGQSFKDKVLVCPGPKAPPAGPEPFTSRDSRAPPRKR